MEPGEGGVMVGAQKTRDERSEKTTTTRNAHSSSHLAKCVHKASRLYRYRPDSPYFFFLSSVDYFGERLTFYFETHAYTHTVAAFQINIDFPNSLVILWLKIWSIFFLLFLLAWHFWWTHFSFRHTNRVWLGSTFSVSNLWSFVSFHLTSICFLKPFYLKETSLVLLGCLSNAYYHLRNIFETCGQFAKLYWHF